MDGKGGIRSKPKSDLTRMAFLVEVVLALRISRRAVWHKLFQAPA